MASYQEMLSNNKQQREDEKAEMNALNAEYQASRILQSAKDFGQRVFRSLFDDNYVWSEDGTRGLTAGLSREDQIALNDPKRTEYPEEITVTLNKVDSHHDARD